MLIKNSALDFQWNKKFPAVFLLLGADPMQAEAVASTLISGWQRLYPEEVDKKVCQIMDSSEWQTVASEAYSYSLFATATLLDIRFDKKTFDAATKKFLIAYLANPNPQSLLIIRAPQLPFKQVQVFLEKEGAGEGLQVILSTAPTAAALQGWIVGKLKPLCSQFDRHLPALIGQYTEGNLLATAQLLKKLALICEPDEPLTEDMLRSQLSLETEYSLFELADFCLQADVNRALQFIRQASQNKSEAPLVLWLLSQEIRLLMQLSEAIAAGENLQNKARNLKIWSSKVGLYQKAAQRIPYAELKRLLLLCSQMDLWIKTGQPKPVWQYFESIVLSLCSRNALHVG